MTTIQLRDLFSSPSASIVDIQPWMLSLPAADNVVLDFAETSSVAAHVDKIRLNSISLCLLANLLSTLGPDVAIDLVLPTADSLRVQLARTPLFSVLAHHPGLQQQHHELAAWRAFWDPHDGDQRRRLLDAGEHSHDPVQRYLLTLSAPHLRGASQVQSDVRGIVDPWLGRRFISRGRSLERSEAMRDLETAMSELVENVADHAEVGRATRPPCSVAQLMTTAGGGSESADRFRLNVMDNGIGLPKSIKKSRGDLNGLSAVEYALTGRLRHGDRGRGLPHVREVVTRNNGSFFVMFTELFPERNRSIIASIDSAGVVSLGEVALPVFGTLAIGQISLPALVRGNPRLFEVEDDDLAGATV